MTKNDDQKKVILIVDDDDDVRVLLKDVLKDDSVKLVETACGEDALQVVNRQHVDLVVTDLKMPGMPGNELLAEIRDRFPQMPVLVITGKPTLDAAVDCMKGGAIDFLTKPFDILEFRNMVRNALMESDLQRSGDVGQFRKIKKMAGFKLNGLLGEGTSGIVFRGVKDGNTYAVKIFKFVLVTENRKLELKERFIREARFLAENSHPHIVKVYEHGISDSGIPYLVMDLINGRTLKRFIQEEKKLDREQSMDIVRQVADAIGFIHKKNIIHRDVKPENVMIVNRNGKKHVILTDFGIIREQDSNLTMAANIMGSPAYLAPEGFVTARVGFQCDIFSLGVMLYELLIGERPFKADNLFTMATVIQSELPQRPSSIKNDLTPMIDELLARALRKDVETRFRDCKQFIEFLDYARNPNTIPRPLSLPELDTPNWRNE